MDRCGIFVDAGYLLAEGAKDKVGSTARRSDVVVDHETLVQRLCTRATKACGLPVLRVYWYDAAQDGVPTLEQKAIGALPDVKLRLGRLTGGRQKGVDALVYRDLTVLARERAIVTAFLVSGDEDLREGVVAAQEMGMHVTLWGVGQAENQARTLKAEVDRCDVLDDIEDLFVPVSRPAPVVGSPVPGLAATGPDDQDTVARIARGFAGEWLARVTQDELADLLRVRPVIPTSLDAELLRSLQATFGDLRRRDDLRHAARSAFWAAIDETGGVEA